MVRRGWRSLSVVGVAVGLLLGCSKDPEVSITSITDEEVATTGSTTDTTASPVAPGSSTPTTVAGDDGYSIATTSTQAKQPPTSTPSAKRLEDGSVVSAGGYVARTPSVANGMLKEPQWSLEQQPYVDMLHEYFDEFFLAQADGVEPTGKPTPEMLALEEERKDLNPHGIAAPSFFLGKRLDEMSMATWPPETDSQIVITEVVSTKLSQNFRICELNDQVIRRYPEGEVVDDGVSSLAWRVSVSLPGAEPKVHTAFIVDGESGPGACEA